MKLHTEHNGPLRLALAGVSHDHIAILDQLAAADFSIVGACDPDPDVLAFAAREGRILVSHDRKTMPTNFANFVATQHSSGLVLLA